MSRRGENIYKRKDNRWEGRYYKSELSKDSSRMGYVYGKTYREAKIKLLQAQLANLQELPKETSYTVASMAEQWLMKERLSVKTSTYSKYRSNIDNHILPWLGALQISELTSVTLNSYIQQLQLYGRTDHNGGLSAKYIRDIFTILKGILHYAEQEYNLKPMTKNCRLPAKECAHARVLSITEQQMLEKYLLEDMYEGKKMGMFFCLYTGLRLGEICALRWEDIDLERELLYVRHTIQRIQNPNTDEMPKTRIVMDTPKSRASIRTVPIPHMICQILQEQHPISNNSAYFLTGSAEHFIEPRNYQYHFNKYMKALCLQGIHLHTLRHTFATRCMEAGVDMKSLSEILGHSGVGITMDCYVHSSIEEKKRQIEKICGTVSFKPSN